MTSNHSQSAPTSARRGAEAGRELQLSELPAGGGFKERPILFSAPMVRAILEGRKTQTRRVVKEVPAWCAEWGYTAFTPAGSISARGPFDDNVGEKFFRLKYGAVGDRLWVRETCRAHELTDKEAAADTFKVMERKGLEFPPYGLDGVVYKADDAFREIASTLAASEAWIELNAYRGKRGAWVNSIHMPRWASRINLEVTGVRVERLQDISQADCVAEGMPESTNGFIHHVVADYRKLWGEINGADSWAANPWVWVIEFRRVPA